MHLLAIHRVPVVADNVHPCAAVALNWYCTHIKSTVSHNAHMFQLHASGAAITAMFGTCGCTQELLSTGDSV